MNARMPVQIPILIGVTGHRDLLAEETVRLRESVRQWIMRLRERFPEATLQLLSSLSPGADLLVAEEALGLGLECIAVLPFPVVSCRADFEDPHELQRFETTLARCRSQIICPSKRPGAAHGVDRAGHYAAAGELISSTALILLALWDGHQSQREHAAGTARTVQFRLEQRAWLDETSGPHQELLPNLPPDPVYHIVTSRRDSAPAAGLEPLQAGYLTHLGGALEAGLPASVELIVKRTCELNRELRRNARADGHGSARAELIGELAAPPANVIEAAWVFGAIDSLATSLHRAVLFWLFGTAGITLLIGVSFLLYAHADADDWRQNMIFVYLGALLLLFLTNLFASRRQSRRRHLEARALAEGLRVELFWAIAGVPAEGHGPAAHRRILKQVDPGLEWIPNAIRASALSLVEVRQAGLPGGIDFALRRWIGSDGQPDQGSGQLHYFQFAGRAKALQGALADAAAALTMLTAFAVTLVLITDRSPWVTNHHHWLLFWMGFLPLFGAVIETSVHRTAGRELRRQYEYMHEVFRSARDRLIRANSDTERRAILALLGHAALSEHAEWLFLHRDRPLDRGGLQ